MTNHRKNLKLLEIQFQPDNFSDNPWIDEDSHEYVYEKFIDHIDYLIRKINGSEIILHQDEYFIQIANKIFIYKKELSEKIWKKVYNEIWEIEIFALVKPEITNDNIDKFLRKLSSELECNFYANYPISDNLIITQCYDNGDHDSGYFFTDQKNKSDYIIKNESEFYFKVAEKLKIIF